jgi:DNA polymerase III delta prime subunit
MNMIRKPTLNPHNEELLEIIIEKMPQSLLITGESGVGLTTVAKYVAISRGVTPILILPEKDEKVDPEKGVIGVDLMRRLYDDTRTKTPDQRIFIIDFAERMTIQAQNAFLKLLEEPGEGVYFILVSHSMSKLLPTILSRVENLEIRPITTDQSKLLLDSLELTDPKKREQLLYIADGLPAELTILAGDEDYFKKRSSMIRDARQLLNGSLYQKLLIANKYKDDRTQALRLLLDAENILVKSITANPKVDAIEHVDRLLETYQRLESNGNIRLSLAQMALYR